MTALLPVVAPHLVIVQATALCNLNCSYCYLPDRQIKGNIGDDVLGAVADFVFACDLSAGRVDMLWHAGEPLAAGLPFYERTFELFAQRAPSGVSVRHVMQTNGTLITRAWCEFLVKHQVNVGLSIDGPAEFHDAHRRTWDGRGTHAKVMAGYELLREAGFAPGAICVLTGDSLDAPDRIYDFFHDNGFTSIAFNIEEAEGIHQRSSWADVDAGEMRLRYESFMSRIWDRWRADGSTMRIREFQQLTSAIRTLRSDGTFVREPHETIPFGIITIRGDGTLGTFSPELSADTSSQYADFSVGNVLTDTPADMAQRLVSSRLYRDVAASREMCKDRCRYYSLCGGGLYSNKHAEHGTLLATETSVCRLHRQALADVVLDKLVAESRSNN
jgi:uncharacterized protein